MYYDSTTSLLKKLKLIVHQPTNHNSITTTTTTQKDYTAAIALVMTMAIVAWEYTNAVARFICFFIRAYV